MTLSVVDYLVIAAYLVAITAFGSWFAKFQKTTRDYFLADRSSPWWAICFTIVATETSTLSFIGVPAQAYAGSMGFLQLAVGYIIGRVIVSAIFIPAYFRGELVTSYELLQRRFGPAVKTAASGIFLITRSLADGIRLFATALVIAVVTGVPVPLTVVVLGAAMIVYTVRGGASAVIWTDVVQMFVYIGGAGLVFWALLERIPGGWSEVVDVGTAAGKFAVLNFSTDPKVVYTFWAGLVGGVALTLATHGTDQFLVQRLLSARSAREASAGLVLSGFIVFAQFTLFLVIGVMLFTYYQHVPAPGAWPHGRDSADVRRELADRRRCGVHRRGDCGRRAVAVAQLDGGGDGERLLRQVHPSGRHRARSRCGWRGSRRLAGASFRSRVALGRAVDGSVRARCRPRGAVAGRRPGAWARFWSASSRRA